MRAKPVLRTLALLFTAGLLSHAQEKPSPDPQVQFHEIPQTATAKALGEASNKRSEALDKVNGIYRKDLAAALATATDIEIYLLDFTTSPVKQRPYHWELELPEDQFPIIPYDASSKILQRKKLNEAEIKRFMPAFQSVLSAQEAPGGAACHYPIHGIRIRDGGNIVFQTSLCYLCGNFYVAYPLALAEWTGISGTELGKVMKELMPIPQKELDRFAVEVEGRKPAEPEKK